MPFRENRRTGAVAGIIGCLVLTLASQGVGQTKPGSAPPANAGGGQQSNMQRIGAVRIAYGRLTFALKNVKGGGSGFVMNAIGGPKGAPNADFLSERYDLSAPRIQISVSSGAVTEAHATGGTHLVVRQVVTVRDGEGTREAKRVINLTSPTATYFGAEKNAKGTVTRPARIEMRGGVRGTVTGPEIDPKDPLQVNTEAVDVVFVDPETTTVEFKEGTATGTPLEPQPKKKQ